jgi:hypothetical protein
MPTDPTDTHEPTDPADPPALAAPDPAVLIPRDPAKRAALAKFAGLTDEERAAIDQWCYDQEMQRQQGVLLCEAERTHGI